MKREKDFLTYNQQLKKLRSAKKIDCGGSSDKEILVRTGYFNLINGYKTPFVCDTDVNTGDHIYIPGTTLNHFSKLKKFDDELRILLLKYITQIEEEVRTLTGYKFDQCNNEGKIPWFDTEAYSSTSRLQARMNAISSAYSELSKSHLDYVRFYMDKHESIPTWIMIKVINFSTFIDVVKNSKNGVTHSLCELYDIKDEEGYHNVKLLIGSLHWLRKVRNSCAHNERIYCIRESKDKEKKNGRIIEKYFSNLRPSYRRDSEKKIMDLLVYFKYYLPDKEFQELIRTLTRMMATLKSSITSNAFDNIRGQMGIKDLSDLEKLSHLQKQKIDYNKFERFSDK